MKDNLCLKNGNILYILNILKKYSDEEHILSAKDITKLVEEEYGVKNDNRTIRRDIKLLIDKFDYNISTREDNNKGYYLIKDYYNDFNIGEIRTIIDTISFAPYITYKRSNSIIEKCMNLLNEYEIDMLSDYKIISDNIKTINDEVIDNIEIIYDAIYKNKQISFKYNHYTLDSNKLVFRPLTDEIRIVSPCLIINSIQEFYLIGYKENERVIKTYKIDRMTRVKILDKKCTKVDKDEIKKIVDSKMSMFAGNPMEITIKCDNVLLDNVVELLGRKLNYKIYDNNHFKVTINVNEEGFIAWYLRNLGRVEILKPLSLKDKINDILKKNIY